jgi:hypothetical protein
MLDLEGDKEKRFRSGFDEYYEVDESLWFIFYSMYTH